MRRWHGYRKKKIEVCIMGGRSTNGVPIKNVHTACFREDIIREILDGMFKTKGSLFRVKNITRVNGLKGQKISPYMPHLVESGCVKIMNYNGRYMKYKKLIEPKDVEEKILLMKQLEERRDRGAMYPRQNKRM